jgi:hypothetical protein
MESLFAIVEQLSGEELRDLVRDGVGWVVYETEREIELATENVTRGWL